MIAKRFFYVCAGILCLALAYHFGALSATAQAPGNPVVGIAYFAAAGNSGVAVTTNGDVYESVAGSDYSSWSLRGKPVRRPHPRIAADMGPGEGPLSARRAGRAAGQIGG